LPIPQSWRLHFDVILNQSIDKALVHSSIKALVTYFLPKL
jgi:hypothetical protein